MVDASTLGAPAVPTVQAGEGTSGSGQLQTSTSESQCAWIFKEGGAETTRLMNLINLEMLKSSAVKKLTSTAKPVSMPAANHESLKKQIKNEFARSMGLMSIGGGATGDGEQGGKEAHQDQDGQKPFKKGQQKKSQSGNQVVGFCLPAYRRLNPAFETDLRLFIHRLISVSPNHRLKK